METCPICEGSLPPWPGRGRPRTYCDGKCKDRARYIAELERTAAAWDERGYPDRKRHVENVIATRLRKWRAA